MRAWEGWDAKKIDQEFRVRPISMVVFLLSLSINYFSQEFWYNQEWERGEGGGERNGDNSLRGPFGQERILFFPQLE